jgi:hypothetical protein
MLMSGGSVSDVISSLFSVMLALAGCGKKTSLPLGSGVVVLQRRHHLPLQSAGRLHHYQL